jgi:hypothetical protein
MPDTSKTGRAPDPRTPTKGHVYAHRNNQAIRVVVVQVIAGGLVGSVVYRRVDGGRLTRLNVSRFDSLYVHESTAPSPEALPHG